MRPPAARAARTLAVGSAVLAVAIFLPWLAAQQAAGEITLIAADGRRSIETVDVQGQEVIALEDLAALFRFDIGEDTRARTVTVHAGGGSVILTAGQALASVDGRLVSLDAPAMRVGGRWFVPLDFIGRALAPVHEERLELRRRSRLLLAGGVRVPRVSARYRPRARSGRLSLEVTPRTPHEVTEDDGRVIVRFDADAIDLVRPVEARGNAVRSIEVLDELPGFAVEPGPAYTSHRVTTVPGGDSARLDIDFETAPAAATAPPAAPPSTEPRREAPAGDPLARLMAPVEIRTIVIDPGHGGADEGAHGPEGTLEKDVTLSVALRLRAMLERRLGVRVILTRTRDTLVDLDRRAAIANNDRADLLISLHANSSLSEIASGAEVFYLSIDEYGAEARAIAAGEGQHLPVSGGGVREIDVVPWEMAQARYLKQSADLAALVAAELHRWIPMSARPIQQAPFRVLVGANMPAILIEMGFLSNPAQERQLAQPAFQSMVAEAIVAGVIRFRDHLASAPYAPVDETASGAGDRAAPASAGDGRAPHGAIDEPGRE